MATSRWRGGMRVTSRPAIRTAPVVSGSRPATIRSVVLFPHPDGPTSTTNSPGATSRLTSSTATTPPGNSLRTPSSTIPASGGATEHPPDVAVEHERDDRRRQHREHAGGGEQRIVGRVLADVLRDQHRDRLAVQGGREQERDQELAPDGEHHERPERGDAGGHLRPHDPPERLPARAPVDQRRLLGLERQLV